MRSSSLLSSVPVRPAGYGGLLLATLLLLSFAHEAEAQSAADVRGTVQLRLSGGLRLAELGNEGSGFPYSNLFNQRFYGQAEAHFLLSRAFSVSTALLFSADRYKNAFCPFLPPCVSVDAAFYFAAPEVRLKYHRQQEGVDHYLGVGISYGFADVRRRKRTSAPHLFARSPKPGFTILSGFSYAFARRFSFFAEGGYRWLEVDFPERGAGFDPLTYRFTGPFGLAGVGLNL